MTTDTWEHARRLREQKKTRTKKENRLLSAVEDVIYDEMLERNADRDHTYLHPSDMAKINWCPRATYFTMTDTEESNPDTFNLRRLNIFAEGHNIHAKWQEWLRRAGVLWGNWHCKWCGHEWDDQSPSHCPLCFEGPPLYNEVKIHSPEHHIIGHTDGWIKDKKGEALLEIKSVGLGTIRWDAPTMYEAYADGKIDLDELWKRIRRPLTSHTRQIQLYMYLLGVEDAIVLYEWKPTQEVKEFHLKLDMEIVQPLLDGAADVVAHLENGHPPVKPKAATSKSCDMCRFCAYKDMCHDGG